MKIVSIKDTYEKIKRQKYSDKLLSIDYIKQFIYRDSERSGLVKTYLMNNITDPKGNVFEIEDTSISGLFFNEAILQLDKAVMNWSAYKRLVSNGLWSWAYVTLYYAQFYSVISMLNIQGTAFSRPKFIIETNSEKEYQFHIYPKEFEKGIFIAEQRRLGKPHEDVWKQYYDTYSKFSYKLQLFHELYSYDKENKLEPTQLRNYLNYDIKYCLNEYNFSDEEMKNYIEIMSDNIFTEGRILKDNSYIEYIATLRIKLLYLILREIVEENIHEDIMFHDENRIKMLNKIKDNTSVLSNYTDWSHAP